MELSMAILDNAFTCSNGHSFTANAKIRARCPECGVTARRNFVKAEAKPEAKITVPTGTGKVEAKVEPKVVVKKPILLKQGRPRVVMTKQVPARHHVGRPKPKLMGAKSPRVASGLVKSRKIKTRGTMPTIKGRPIKTAVARGIKDHGTPRSSKPFWHDVADKYGF